jgi:hypothetical protein
VCRVSAFRTIPVSFSLFVLCVGLLSYDFVNDRGPHRNTKEANSLPFVMNRIDESPLSSPTPPLLPLIDVLPPSPRQMSSMDAKLTAALSDKSSGLSAEDVKVLSEALPSNGVQSIDDVTRLSREDLVELKLSLGTRNRLLELIQKLKPAPTPAPAPVKPVTPPVVKPVTPPTNPNTPPSDKWNCPQCTAEVPHCITAALDDAVPPAPAHRTLTRILQNACLCFLLCCTHTRLYHCRRTVCTVASAWCVGLPTPAFSAARRWWVPATASAGSAGAVAWPLR